MSRVVALLTMGLCLGASPAGAVEYRLEVASLYREAFAHYFDGGMAAGTGQPAMSRLERDLDSGRTEPSVVLSDRPLRYGWEAVARSFEASKVIAEVKPLESPRRWDQVVWDGKPGERSVWVIAPSGRHFQEVYHVAVKGAEAGAGLRYHVPDRVALRGRPQAVVGYPLSLLRFYEGRSDLWRRYLSKSLDLGGGIAVVVGIGDNPTFPDWAYIVVEQPPSPTTFKVVLGWQRREAPEAPSLDTRDP
jgi:hypothetical protein